MKRVLQSGVPESFYQRRDGQSVIYYLVPIRGRPSRTIGVMELVHLGKQVDERVDAATRDVWIRLALLAVLLATLAGLMLQREVLRPLSRLLGGIRRLGEGQPGPPLPVDRRDEIGRVAEAFNEMAERLEVARRTLMTETERTLDLEQQLRQAETLAVAGKLASGIAHEVGTPLNIISGRAEFLLKSLDADDPRRRDLTAIVGQIDRISGIIRALLDVVRRQKPEVQPVALPEVWQRLSPLLEHAARRRGVRLITALSPDLPRLSADPNQLQQVLINLLVNALEASSPGSRIELEAAPAARDGRPGLQITVSDHGPGIPDEALARVFEPFFTTKPRGQGTGLGLAISRDIVREHGGDIRAESEAGGGARFAVWLPEAGA
jgi:signal transduction histidine kinase